MASSLGSTLAGGSDDYRGCDYCGDEREAVGYCLDCKHYLCAYCFNGHRKPPPLRHHVLLYRNQTPASDQHHSDTVDDQLRQRPHVQESITSGPTPAACRTSLRYPMFIVAVLVFLLGAWLGHQGRLNTDMQIKEGQQDSSTYDSSMVERVSVHSEASQRTDEQDSINTEVIHEDGQKGTLNADSVQSLDEQCINTGNDNKDSHLESINTEIDNKVLELDNIKTEIDSKLSKLISINTEIDNKESKLESINTEIDNKESKLESINTEIDNKESKLESINTEIDNKESKLESITTEIDNKESKLESINTEIDNKESKLESITTEIDNKESKLESINTEIDNKESKLESITTEIDNKVGNLDSIKTKINNKVSKLDRIQIEFDNKVSKLDSINTEIDNKVNELDSIKTEIDNGVSELESINIELDNKVSQLDNINTEIDNKISIQNEMDNKEGWPGSDATKNTGTLKWFETDTSDKRERMKTEHSHISGQQSGKGTRVELMDDIDVMTRDDNDMPGITDCVVLPYNKLVVLDMDNSKVKLIDLIYNTVQDQLTLPNYIWGVTKVSSTQVAITGFTKETIYFVNVGDKLKLHRTVKVEGKCMGIATLNDKLVVSYDKPLKVKILNMNGQLLQTIKTRHEGELLFNYPWYVAVSRDQTSLYITDWHRNTVTRLPLNDDDPVIYQDDKLVVPFGVMIDKIGKVYIVGGGSNNLVQLAADLSWPRFLLQSTDGIDKPRSVCYCKTTDKVFIGMRSNIVKVFQLIR